MEKESQFRMQLHRDKQRARRTNGFLNPNTRIFVKIDAAVYMSYDSSEPIYNIATAGLGPCIALTYYYDASSHASTSASSANPPGKIGLLARLAKARNYKREFTEGYVAKLLLFIVDESYRDMIEHNQDISFDEALEKIKFISRDLISCKLIYGENREESHLEDLKMCLSSIEINFKEIAFPNIPNIYLDLRSGEIYNYTSKEIRNIVDKIDKRSLGHSKNSLYLNLNEGNLEIYPLLESFYDTIDVLNEIEDLIKHNSNESYINYKSEVIDKCQNYIKQSGKDEYILHSALIDAFLYWIKTFIQKNEQAEPLDNIKAVLRNLESAFYDFDELICDLTEKEQQEELKLNYLKIEKEVKKSHMFK